MKIAPKAFNKFRLYRQRRFWTISFIKFWWRSVAVIGVLIWAFHSVKPVEYWTRPVYVLIAIGYLWMDTYYNVKSLERKWESNRRSQMSRHMYRKMAAEIAHLKTPPTS